MAARRKPEITFTGATLDQWQSSIDNITWAQNTPQFKVMLSIVLNELQSIQFDGTESEPCKLGNVQGYLKAVEVLRSLGRHPDKTRPSAADTFDEPSQNAFKDKEPLD